MKKRRRGSQVKHQSIATLLAAVLGVGGAVHADLPLGIFGGEGLDSSPYGGIFSPDGTVTLFSDFPMGSGFINSVAINIDGSGLIGGSVDSNGYAAYVDSSGTLTSLTVSPTNISSVSINSTANGLIGGSGAYIAQVFPDGTVTPLSTSADLINQVSLNDANIGLVGGEGSAVPYAAFASPDGTLEVLSIPPLGTGNILCVALNENSVGIIGGYVDPSGLEGYTAFVSPGSDPTRITVPVGQVQSVAINRSNLGLMGGAGSNMVQQLYAGYITQDDTFTDLFPSTSDGAINSVALNDSGLGIIGGYSGNPQELYAAFVHPDGSINPLFPGGALGEIHSVALNDADVGIIGGETDSEGFIAVIAPNGTVTELSAFNGFGLSAEAMRAKLPFQNGSVFNSVGLLNSVANAVTPTSIGPYNSVIASQLAASTALENRFVGQNRVMAKTRNKDLCLTPKWIDQPFDPNSIWIEPFGNLVYVQKEGKIPAFSNEIGGVLLGYDGQGKNLIVGAALGYAFNYASFSDGIGHAKIQEEIGTLYSAFYAKHFWMGLALWGGLYQVSSARHTL